MTRHLESRRPSSTISTEILDGETVYHKQYQVGDWGDSSEVIRRRLSREIELLSRLKDILGTCKHLGVLEVVSSDIRRASVVTREVPGSTIEARLIKSFSVRSDRECLRALYLSGYWLKRFQELPLGDSDGQPISRRVDPVDLATYCRLRLEGLGDYGYRWPKRAMITRIIARIERLVSASPPGDRQRVWAHADYGPGNIMWDGKRLTVLDLAMAHGDRPLLDVTYFIHRLEMLRVYRPWKRWPIEFWKKAFLRGYGRPDAESSPMYHALMMRHLICRLHTYVRRPPRDFKQKLHDRWVRMVLRRKLERMAAGA